MAKKKYEAPPKLKSGGMPIPIDQLRLNQFCLDRTKGIMKENTIMSLNELCGKMGFHRRTIQRALIDLIETGYVMDIQNHDYEYID